MGTMGAALLFCAGSELGDTSFITVHGHCGKKFELSFQACVHKVTSLYILDLCV